ncbi:DinB family protein [Sabulilitoribacter multivorans]|uniref:DinB family protein n=1 Tax=Flaviramulus multivorans TaxID=1304750 RepID=A0ABS9IEK2_9FLAO|nr:DinB family protein [Flaviramulus multivorans]MCF7559005.1 DinB family protein [Flaviramulus multivorans]
METTKLISELTALTYQNIEDAEDMLQKSMDELNWKINVNIWSALECIAHLNLYSNFYLPEIKYGINQDITPTDTVFVPGLIGDFFVNSIRLNEKTKKMKTPKEMNPNGSVLSKETLNKFIRDQYDLISLLDDARNVNLNKTKTAISISKLIKLKLGDTFRFVIYHNERHILQAMRTLYLQKKKAA